MSFGGTLSCQTVNEYFDAEVSDNFSISHFTNENGLKQIIVNHILLDEYNFLWLLTPSGVARFDGAKFTYFNSSKGDRSRAKGVFKSQKYEDTYFVKFAKGEIGKITKGGFEIMSELEMEKIYDFETRVIEKDSSYNFNSFLRNKPNRSLIDIYPIDSRHHYVRGPDSISYLQDGKELITYFDPLLSRNEFYENSKSHVQLGEYILNLRTNLTMVLLNKGTLQEIIDINKKTANKYDNLAANEIILIKGVNKRDAFIKVRGDLYQIVKTQKSIAFIPLGISTKIPLISGIQIDNTGNNIFISSKSSGLFILKKKTFYDSYDKLFPESQSYQSHLELPDGRILTNHNTIIGTDLSLNINNLNNANNFFKYDDYSCFIVNRVTANIYSYDYESEKINLFYQDEEARQFSNVFLDKEGVFWVNKIMQPGKQNEIGFINRSGTYKKVSTISSNTRSINWTPFDKLQLNTDSLIYYLDTNDFSIDTIIPPVLLEIRDVLFLNDSLSVLATYNKGLWFLQNNVFEKLQIENEKLNEANSIIRDEQNNIWVSTNNGLVKFEANSLESYWNVPFDEIYYTYYDRSYGYSNNEFNGGEVACSNLLMDGRLSFASVQGIVFVNPQELIDTVASSPKILIDVSVDNQLLNPQLENRLDSDFQRINISISSPNYGNKGNLHLYYRLNGFDEHWISYDPSQPISYTQLKPNDYTLEIKLLTGPNKKDVIQRHVNFSVENKWYQGAFAVVGFFCLLTFIYYLLFRFRVQYLKRQKQKLESIVNIRTKEINRMNKKLNSINGVKNKLLGIVSHEMVGSIQMIYNTSNYISSNKEDIDKAAVLDFLEEIKETSKNTTELLRNILTWVKSQNEDIKLIDEEINVHRMVGSILAKLDVYAKNNNIQLSNNLPKSLNIKTDKNVFTLIVHSLIENEVKHNSNSSILLVASNEDDEFDFEIINKNDEGTLDVAQTNAFFNAEKQDMDSSVLISGLGFWIIKDLLKKCNGRILYVRDSSIGHTIKLKL